MASDVVSTSTTEQMYINSCRRHGVLPNTAILSSFFETEIKKSYTELHILEIFLDHLKDIDIPPLLEVCAAINNSEIEAVDIRNGTSCELTGECVLSLMLALNQKLRQVDLQDSSLGKDFMREISQRGLTCQVLNLKSLHLRKLNMAGEFMRMHTLNLDFSTSLSSFREDCFTCMPNLKCVSMCETRVANLWTTIAAISKLSSLLELHFQKWVCCNDAVCSSTLSAENLEHQLSCHRPSCFKMGLPLLDVGEHRDLNSSAEDEPGVTFSINNAATSQQVQSMMEDSSDESGMDFSYHSQEFDYTDVSSDVSQGWSRQVNLQNEMSIDTLWKQTEESLSDASTKYNEDIALKYISCHASPICYEKHYREYMIASLPRLKVLDNLSIRNIDRERAATTFAQYFEYLPYKRKRKESVVNILHNREIKENCYYLQTKNQKSSYCPGNSQYFYRRSLCAAKVGSSAWPSLRSLSVSGHGLGNASQNFRPRQFEYHPSISSLMVFGTLDGEVVIINHENGKVIGCAPSLGTMNSVLGLCWLKKFPFKLIAGSDNGLLKLYDIEHLSTTTSATNSNACSITFDEFDQLTSVNVNSTDELFLASGYSKNVGLYDINYGKRIQVFTDMHREHINVVKFSNHSPSIFATSSFDRDVKLWDLRQSPIRPCYTTSSSKGNVMVCFSPDDHYLLASAVDNEVRQFLAVDGRLHLNFEIEPTGSSQNYTRSYYMNGRDYIISGSCDEHVVRVCCSQTGRRLRDISLEGRGSRNSMYVQSLRGDPIRDFNMSILAAYMRPSSKSEIVKVNLLASCDHVDQHSNQRHSCPSNRMGG